MKTKILLVTMLIMNLVVTAQNTKNNNNELGAISLSVILPDNSENLSYKALSKIESKIQHIVSRYGISGQGYSNDFLIYPKFEIYDESRIEAMRNFYKITADFNLFIKQYKTGKVFSSYHRTITGTGFTKEKAIINAISKIPVDDPKLKKFIDEGKRKILEYYENNCDQIANDADAFIKRKLYNKAIALLYTVPKEAKKCYAKIQDKSVKAYNAYQDQKCNENIMRAKSEIAKNDYNYALSILGYIDPTSKCASTAKSLISQTAQKVDAKERKEWNFMLKRYQDNINMEKYRLQIMKEIAKAYYKSKPQTIIYKSLF